MEKTISLICVYNNEDILNQHLLKSVQVQTVQPELILLDNRKNKFMSAAQALNEGAMKATGDFLVFVHQDIELLQKNDLGKLLTLLHSNEDTVFGSAGIKFKQKGVFSNMLHGKEKIRAGANRISDLCYVDTLDECFIGCSKALFEKIRFDETLCNGWDLYGVDFCYQAKLKKKRIAVVPFKLWHVSPGNPKHAFYDCARRMSKKYSHVLPYIQSCCITVPIQTNWLGRVILYVLEFLNRLRR